METSVEDAGLTRAVVAYLGKGRSPFPRSDADAVAEVAEDRDVPALLARVRTVIDDMMSITIDWSAVSLSEGGRQAQRIIADRHPELGHDALEALYWMFTYQWR